MTAAAGTKPTTVTCLACGDAITSREALVVAGQWLQPLHATCLGGYEARQPWYRRPLWPVNRWSVFVRLNAILVSIVLGLHFTIAPLPDDAWPGLGSILLVANGWMLVARGISYFSYERRLPRGGK